MVNMAPLFVNRRVGGLEIEYMDMEKWFTVNRRVGGLEMLRPVRFS